jgi:hypothetical protein
VSKETYYSVKRDLLKRDVPAPLLFLSTNERVEIELLLAVGKVASRWLCGKGPRAIFSSERGGGR